MRDAPSEEQHRLLTHLEALVAASAGPPDAAAPVAWMQLESRGRTRDYLLGWRTEVGGAVTVLHWQTSPLAAVFFSTRVGDDYEIAVDGRTLEGSLRARCLLDLAAGVLVEVATDTAVLSRRDGGPWRRVGEALPPLLTPRPAGAGR
ncbi:MAG: UvrD/Rep helicase family protein, partial [Myxococcaceae bacterium]|nr:UvrD/Rep helicase family protein [Myxococcaceae bacterium]